MIKLIIVLLLIFPIVLLADDLPTKDQKVCDNMVNIAGMVMKNKQYGTSKQEILKITKQELKGNSKDYYLATLNIIDLVYDNSPIYNEKADKDYAISFFKKKVRAKCY